MNKIFRKVRFWFRGKRIKLKYAKLRRQGRCGKVLAEIIGAEKASEIMSILIKQVGLEEANKLVSKITRKFKNPKEIYTILIYNNPGK